MIIYKTTNLINGEFYVGADSKNNPNYLGSGIKIKRAIKKYGKQNFVKETIESCENEKQLFEREKIWIKELKPEYNISPGGDGGWLGKEANEKRRKSLEGHEVSQETRIKIGNANRGNNYKKGKKLSEESKKKISESHKGVLVGKNNPMYGKHHTEETKRKISESNKGKLVGDLNPARRPEVRKKMSERVKGENNPMKRPEVREKMCGENNPAKRPEVRKKISKNRQGKCIGENHPNYGKSRPESCRRKISIANKGKIRSEEARKKIAESCRKYWENKKNEKIRIAKNN